MSNLCKRPIYKKGTKPLKAPVLRQAAQGRECMLKIPGACTGNAEETVGCHIRLPGFCGMSQKSSDLFIIDGCQACHSVLDDRSRWADAEFGFDDLLRSFMKTLEARYLAGLITVKGAE